jgi:hypothetical protein
MKPAEVGQPPLKTGWSVCEAELFSHLSDHAAHEGALLDEYTHAAGATQSKALAYLIGILMEDERKHHRWFDELASSLQTEATLTGADPTIPRMDFHRADSVSIHDLTDRLLEHEKADERELKRLQHEMSDVQDTTLWGLLVDLMLRDTDKHIAILRFVNKHLDTFG